MSVNKSTIDWLESQEHPVAICVVWTKEDVDKHQTDLGKSSLTVDQWNHLVSILENDGPGEADWANVDWCIKEMESEVLK